LYVFVSNVLTNHCKRENKIKVRYNLKFITCCSLLLMNYCNTLAQITNVERTKIRYFEIGIGLPSITFRDRITTSLAYSGSGLASLHLGNTKHDANKMFCQFSFDANVMGAKPAITNVSAWNKKASIFNYSFTYRKLKGVAQSKNKKWHYYAGASLSHNGQLAIIPSANNSLAYNMNLLQAGVEGMVKRDFQWHNKDFQFTYQVSLPLLGLNVRPQSYIGLPPQDAIWGDASTISTLFKDPRFASFHNNFIFKNDISLDMRLRKSKLRLQYTWQFTSNKVSVNSLNSVVSAINIAYLVKLKNK
jgi:hypothetical protein